MNTPNQKQQRDAPDQADRSPRDSQQRAQRTADFERQDEADPNRRGPGYADTDRDETRPRDEDEIDDVIGEALRQDLNEPDADMPELKPQGDPLRQSERDKNERDSAGAAQPQADGTPYGDDRTTL